MDGRNSLGRRISLLNESEGPVYAHPKHSSSYSRSYCTSRTNSSSQVPSYRPQLPQRQHFHSRTSSFASSPRTPPLSRSGSSDSTDSRMMHIHSPITPDFTFEAPFPITTQLPSPDLATKQGFFPPLPKDNNVQPNLAGFVLPAQNLTAPFLYGMPVVPAAVTAAQTQFVPAVDLVAQPTSPTQAPETKGGSTSKPQSKKNQYPCPMAKQFNCPDYFTTSGHAARHAKKHTGRKDAICPECNKAFTRKDNMEQHRRTHQNGRTTQRSSEEGASSSSSSTKKGKAAAQPPANKRPRPSPLQQTAELPAVIAPSALDAPLIDPLLPTSPDSALAFADVNLVPGALQPLTAFTSPYIDPEPYRYDPQLSTSFTAGLDTLAIVATDAERKRKHGE